MTTASTYTPAVGDLVRVRRFKVPTPELPGTAERRLLEEYTGTVATVQPKAGGVLFRLEAMEDPIFTGDQFSGQDPDYGVSWSLVTEVEHLPKDLAEAIEGTAPGYLFADRELLNITRLALDAIYRAPDGQGSAQVREAARQALARLEGRTSL